MTKNEKLIIRKNRQASSSKKEDSPELSAFEKLKISYGIEDPQQIQLKILWFHVQQLISVAYPGKETEITLKKYDEHWSECDRAIKATKALGAGQEI